MSQLRRSRPANRRESTPTHSLSKLKEPQPRKVQSVTSVMGA
nr:MAG TPA: hypothetical protein [Caudoviricetes sp.]